MLFKALVTDAELPGASGPVHALLREHAEMEEWLREMTPFLEQSPQSEDDRGRLGPWQFATRTRSGAISTRRTPSCTRKGRSGLAGAAFASCRIGL